MTFEAQFTVSNKESKYSAELKIVMLTEVEGDYSTLFFSLAKPMNPETVVGGRFVGRHGDLHEIELDQSFSDLNEISIEFSGEGQLLKATDYPEGLYLQDMSLTLELNQIEVILDRPVIRNKHGDNLTQSDSAVFIPYCKQTQSETIINWPKSFQFIDSKWNVDWLTRLMNRLEVPIITEAGHNSWDIVYQQDDTLKEEFELTISLKGAQLISRSEQGFYLGQSYLFQYLLQWSLQKQLKEVHLLGTPDYQYRGLHIDVVRHFFTAGQIIDWMDIIALFQYRQFHWHLTDDDGWRVKSDAFPNLKAVGSKRGPGLPLPAQMGTGMHLYEGQYTHEEVRSVVSRCTELGLEVVPEMDIPGHARALLKSIPELIEADDGSKYLSVQHYSDNVINPLFGKTNSIIESLISEWLQLFPGALFHVGADEVPKGAWEKSPVAASWLTKNGKDVTEVQGVLMSAIEAQLNVNGKIMAGWEEVTDGGGTSKDTWVYSWQGVEAGKIAAKAGHPVVMTPAQYCYLDLAVTDGFSDPGYYWAGTVSLEKTYSYNPLEGIPTEHHKQIKGVQMCLWSELLSSEAEAEYMLFPRLLAGAEIGWGSNIDVSYANFHLRTQVWMPILSRLGLFVRSEQEGW